VTDGIISALDRTFPTEDERRSYGGLIQTSAAINRGNSGGPLVNLRGEVIGINAAIFSTSQGSEGIGFAIPINRAKARLKELITGEKIRYGYLGITPVDIDPVKVERLARQGTTIPRGVFVYGVERGHPAEKAGLREEDIIVKLGDKAIVNRAQLIDILANTPEGTEMPITVVRDGKSTVKKVTIGGWTPPYFTWDGELES
jgi:serine protease Do